MAAACGTYSGWARHKAAGESPCVSCLTAQREYHRAYRSAGRKKAYTLECAYCLTTFTALDKRGRYCSDLCFLFTRNGPLSCPVPKRHPSRKQPRRPTLPKQRTTSRVFVTDCRICGRCFVSPYTTITCGPECAEVKLLCDKREAKHRRRARKRGAFVAPVFRLAIYQRDDWRCHLCGRLVDKSKTAPHPLAPVLDHVVPLSRGGTHEPANVATAHFLCNSRKGDRGGGEQLRLIG